MTMPSEELNSIKRTREFLRSIMRKSVTEIRKDAIDIRDRAYRCLKHYPGDMTVDKLWKDRIDNELK